MFKEPLIPAALALTLGTGDLTISGITTSVDLDTTFIGEGKYPWGGYRAGFTATATIDLDDYGMGGVIGPEDVVLAGF